MRENKDVKLVLEVMQRQRHPDVGEAIEAVKLLREKFPTRSLFSQMLSMIRKPR